MIFSLSIGARGGRDLCHASSRDLRRRLWSASQRPQHYTRTLSCRPSERCTPDRVGYWGNGEAGGTQHGPSTARRSFSASSSAPEATPSSSVSASEVAHFSRLASSWWDPHGPSRLLHLMNPLRHDFIRACLSSSSAEPSSYSYLDVGCGGGIFACSAARLPSTSTVTAIDPTPECIAVAQKQTAERSCASVSEADIPQLRN